jgi:hypothetical protein
VPIWRPLLTEDAPKWVAATVYALNTTTYNGNRCYKATTGGVSAASPATGPTGTGSGIVDGTVVWAYHPGPVISPALLVPSGAYWIWVPMAPAAHAATHAALGSDPVTLTQAQITNLVADLAAMVIATAAKVPLAGGSMTGTLNNNTNLFLTGTTPLKLGIGFGSGGFSNANAVIESVINTKRYTLLQGAANTVLALLDMAATGKGIALFCDTTGAATIFDAAGSYDFTSDTQANMRAGTFGTGTSRIRVSGAGKVGINNTSPTAWLHIRAGTATANEAPLKFTSGPLLTAPEAGAIEYLTPDLYLTEGAGPTRKRILVAPTQTLDATGPALDGTLVTAPATCSRLFVFGYFDLATDAVNAASVLIEVETAVGSGAYKAVQKCSILTAGAATNLSIPFNFTVIGGARYRFTQTVAGASTAAFGADGYNTDAF